MRLLDKNEWTWKFTRPYLHRSSNLQFEECATALDMVEHVNAAVGGFLKRWVDT